MTDDAGKSLLHPNRGISLEANLKDCFKTSRPHYNTWLIPRIPQGTSAALKSLKVKVAQLCPTLCDPMDYTVSPWNSPSQNTGVDIHSLLQGIFPTQGSNPGLHIAGRFFTIWAISKSREYWSGCPISASTYPSVICPFLGTSLSRNQTGVSCIAGGFFTNWAIREAFFQLNPKLFHKWQLR